MKFILLFSLSFSLFADELDLVGEVVIKPEESKINSYVKKDAIIKTEVVTKEQLAHKQAQTLVDAVAEEMGITTGTACANCGSKRVNINGMRGEHTTVLVDGVPLHSTISSFYGLDAIPVGGIDKLEISRGAGAALTSPESIGGVINVRTAVPEKRSASARLTYGSMDDYMAPFAATTVNARKNFRTVFAGQFSQQNRRDEDGNGVAENPQMQNRSGFAKAILDVTPRDRLSFRVGLQNLDNIGGGADTDRPVFNSSNFTPTFVGNDTDNLFLNDQELITDWVRIKRREFVGQYTRFIGEDSTLEVTAAKAVQQQNSVYNLHSFDYSNDDDVYYGSVKFDTFVSDDYFLTVGLETKQQSMTSFSEKLYGKYAITPLDKDDFRYRNYGAFLQNTIDITDDVELSAAVRADFIQVDWMARTGAGPEIEEVLVSPRAHMKIKHNNVFTSRLSYGLGYRPPLSFFESQHGLNEFGFKLDIDKIEKAHSYGYSLNFQKNILNATLSTHRTSLKNMAYGDTNIALGEPVPLSNYDGTLHIWVNDLAVSLQATPNWTMALRVEDFQYDDEYKALQPNALIERRVSLSSDYHWKNWEFIATANWIGSRNLTEYGYGGHYGKTEVSDPLGPFFGATIPVEQKNQKAPWFVTVDLFASVQVNKNLSFFAGVQNLFDYTQFSENDSPLNFAQHGPDRTHFHLDNNHVWGPLIGRTASMGLNAAF